MKIYHMFLLTALIALILFSCKKPYTPEVTSVNSNLLVVEGTINIGADSTIFKLSRTVLVSSKVTTKPEITAVVNVESDANDTYPLTNKSGGIYIHTGLNVNPGKKYRIRIKLSNGSTYLSDFVSAKISPPIDSISWKADGKGFQVYANTHDASNNSRYYRWEYLETWMFNAKYYSSFYYTNNEILPRDLTQDIYQCWAGAMSPGILLASTVKLDKDLVSESPLTSIPFDSEKVSVKYSILVKQYALTKEAFDFWSALKKNTESLGSIFDAQPSQLTGNVHNSANAAEPVLGYVSAGTTTSKRIFVSREQLPRDWRVKYPTSCAEPDTILLFNPRTGVKATDIFKNTGNIITQGIFTVTGVLTGYLRSGRECADCTVRGTNKQPIFWQ